LIREFYGKYHLPNDIRHAVPSICLLRWCCYVVQLSLKLLFKHILLWLQATAKFSSASNEVILMYIGPSLEKYTYTGRQLNKRMSRNRAKSRSSGNIDPHGSYSKGLVSSTNSTRSLQTSLDENFNYFVGLDIGTTSLSSIQQRILSYPLSTASPLQPQKRVDNDVECNFNLLPQVCSNCDMNFYAARNQVIFYPCLSVSIWSPCWLAYSSITLCLLHTPTSWFRNIAQGTARRVTTFE
jgi:hypothetical protein